MDSILSLIGDEIYKNIFMLVFMFFFGKLCIWLFPLNKDEARKQIPYDYFECEQIAENNRLGCLPIWFISTIILIGLYFLIGEKVYVFIHQVSDMVFIVKPDGFSITTSCVMVAIPITLFWQKKKFIDQYGKQKEAEMTAYFSDKYKFDNRKYSNVIYMGATFIALCCIYILFHFQAAITNDRVIFTSDEMIFSISNEKINDISKIELIKGHLNADGQYVKWPYYKFTFKSGAYYCTGCFDCQGQTRKEAKEIAQFLIEKVSIPVEEVELSK
jgi:hypothetical protein